MNKLAINGGEPSAIRLKENLPKWPVYYEEDKKPIIDILESGQWGRNYVGSKTEEFERSFAKYHDAKWGIAVANGTVAIELALRACGIKAGDEVIVPSVTFIASATAIACVGAIPVFADIDLETAQISPSSMRDLITKRTKAAVVVHYGGYPIDFDQILPIVEENKISLIEDCAHAHGTEWKGRKVGAIGDMGTFSFQLSKSLTAGEGGIILTNDDDYAREMSVRGNIGRRIGQQEYEHSMIGSNYRISEFHGALLLSQFNHLPEETRLKHDNGEYLKDKLRKIGGVEPLKADNRITQRGYYFFIIRYNSKEFGGVHRDVFLKALRAEGVPFVNKGYGVPVYQYKAFEKEQFNEILSWPGIEVPNYSEMSLENAEEFCRNQQITLSHRVLRADRELLDLIPETIIKIKENIRELRNVSSSKT